MKLFEFWENPDGSLSSRRLFGTVLLGIGVAGYFLRLDAILTGTILALGAGLLGLTTADKQGGTQ
jgi:hypothetical protein